MLSYIFTWFVLVATKPPATLSTPWSNDDGEEAATRSPTFEAQTEYNRLILNGLIILMHIRN